jgi:biotin carboxylase
MDLKEKKLLILGANPETALLVNVAREMGVYTVVTDYDSNAYAKKFADKACDVDGMDVPGLIALARAEGVDGVLVGVADMLVPSYYKVCDALGFPCYATQAIAEILSQKDRFKAKCEEYGIHGVPEYHLDEDVRKEDVAKIEFPVMVKPVDSTSGAGMTVCYKADELVPAVVKALSFSRGKRFIVEKYMECDDLGLYYTFKDGLCSASCIYDRYTTNEQRGLSRVCLGSTYPSKHIETYFKTIHPSILRLFRHMAIQNGVLLLQAFYESGVFYVYDTGFRLQGEAPHLLMKAIHGFDQREMLIRFALTGSQGDLDLAAVDDPYFGGKHAATLWFLLRAGIIGQIEGLETAAVDPELIAFVQRLHQGDTVEPEWIGTERQVLARLYLVCETKEALGAKIRYLMDSVKVNDAEGNDMLLQGFNVNSALRI